MTTYLITGGTGSFGVAWLREFVQHHCKLGDSVRVFSRDEQKQARMRGMVGYGFFRYLIGDVRDSDRVYRALDGVDVVVHAAAMKSVPECESNPYEAVRTNIEGTQNIIDAAIDRGVKKVLLVSTDKACIPSNLYGATKLVAESLITHASSYVGKRDTRFAAVRLGNLAGSRGSVVDVWEASEGPLIITDPDMTRFWMSLRDAVGFTWRALADMEGGEVFVPYIPALRLGDLADVLRPDAEWKITGPRVGERTHETLVTAEEVPRSRMVGSSVVIYPTEQPEDRRLRYPLESKFAYRMTHEQIRESL